MVSKLCAGHAGSSGAFAPTKEVPPPAALCKFTAVRDIKVPAVRFVEERGWQAGRASPLAIKSGIIMFVFTSRASPLAIKSSCSSSHDAADIIMFVLTSRASSLAIKTGETFCIFARNQVAMFVFT